METLLNSIMYVNIPMVTLFKSIVFWNYSAISFCKIISFPFLQYLLNSDNICGNSMVTNEVCFLRTATRWINLAMKADMSYFHLVNAWYKPSYPFVSFTQENNS
jgi:hypothetical protein